VRFYKKKTPHFIEIKIMQWDAVGSILKQTKRKTCIKYVDKKSPVMRPNLQPKIYKSPVVA
jgi:uncharacterized protein YbdZ (MbtH family)